MDDRAVADSAHTRWYGLTSSPALRRSLTNNPQPAEDRNAHRRSAKRAKMLPTKQGQQGRDSKTNNQTIITPPPPSVALTALKLPLARVH